MNNNENPKWYYVSNLMFLKSTCTQMSCLLSIVKTCFKKVSTFLLLWFNNLRIANTFFVKDEYKLLFFLCIRQTQ